MAAQGRGRSDRRPRRRRADRGDRQPARRAARGARAPARLVAGDPGRARAGADARAAAPAASRRWRISSPTCAAWSPTGARSPGDPERDVLTRLIQGEADGERLSEQRAAAQLIFILNAGHETTTNLIGNGLLRAARNGPSEKARLIAEPRADPHRGRGAAALRKLQPARQPRDDASRSTLGGIDDAGRHLHHASASAPPTAIPPSSPIPTASTSPASPTGTWPSAPARTCAPGSTSRGWRAASRSQRFLARFPDYRARRRARARRPRPLPRLPVDPGCARLSSGPLQCRSAGTLPPFSASLVITCLCSQMFMDAESPMLPV